MFSVPSSRVFLRSTWPARGPIIAERFVGCELATIPPTLPIMFGRFVNFGNQNDARNDACFPNQRGRTEREAQVELRNELLSLLVHILVLVSRVTAPKFAAFLKSWCLKNGQSDSIKVFLIHNINFLLENFNGNLKKDVKLAPNASRTSEATSPLRFGEDLAFGAAKSNGFNDLVNTFIQPN